MMLMWWGWEWGLLVWFERLLGVGAAKQGRETDRRILVLEEMESECKRYSKKRWRQGDRRRMGL